MIREYITRSFPATPDGGKIVVETISDRAKTIFEETRLKGAEELILKPRGWTLQEFKGHGQQGFPPPIFSNIDQNLYQFGLGVQLLIAGVDDAGAHIWSVFDPGMARCFDSVGYHVLGSGVQHALSVLVVRKQSPQTDLRKTILTVFAAKKMAELAPGVGCTHDFCVITSTGIVHFSAEEVKRINAVYDESIAREQKDGNLDGIPIPQ